MRARRFGAIAAGLLTAGLMVTGAVASAVVVPTAVDGTPKQVPEKGKSLTPGEKAHIRELRKQGEAKGLTKEQIRAEIDAYLKSIGKLPHEPKGKPVKPGTGGAI